MTCDELDPRLDDWLDGSLAGEAAREVRLDLASGHHLRPIRADDIDLDYSAVMAIHTLWLAARAENIGVGCDFYAATFERLFARLVQARARVVEISCHAMGGSDCTFATTR